jgi:hypothetical protein
MRVEEKRVMRMGIITWSRLARRESNVSVTLRAVLVGMLVQGKLEHICRILHGLNQVMLSRLFCLFIYFCYDGARMGPTRSKDDDDDAIKRLRIPITRRLHIGVHSRLFSRHSVKPL